MTSCSEDKLIRLIEVTAYNLWTASQSSENLQDVLSDKLKYFSTGDVAVEISTLTNTDYDGMRLGQVIKTGDDFVRLKLPNGNEIDWVDFGKFIRVPKHVIDVTPVMKGFIDER